MDDHHTSTGTYLAFISHIVHLLYSWVRLNTLPLRFGGLGSRLFYVMPESLAAAVQQRRLSTRRGQPWTLVHRSTFSRRDHLSTFPRSTFSRGDQRVSFAPKHCQPWCYSRRAVLQDPLSPDIYIYSPSPTWPRKKGCDYSGRDGELLRWRSNSALQTISEKWRYRCKFGLLLHNRVRLFPAACSLLVTLISHARSRIALPQDVNLLNDRALFRSAAKPLSVRPACCPKGSPSQRNPSQRSFCQQDGMMVPFTGSIYIVHGRPLMAREFPASRTWAF